MNINEMELFLFIKNTHKIVLYWLNESHNLFIIIRCKLKFYLIINDSEYCLQKLISTIYLK